jgi:hypothetical protein
LASEVCVPIGVYFNTRPWLCVIELIAVAKPVLNSGPVSINRPALVLDRR